MFASFKLDQDIASSVSQYLTLIFACFRKECLTIKFTMKTLSLKLGRIPASFIKIKLFLLCYHGENKNEKFDP